jgi:hypothetical protein
MDWKLGWEVSNQDLVLNVKFGYRSISGGYIAIIISKATNPCSIQDVMQYANTSLSGMKTGRTKWVPRKVRPS